MDRRDFPSFSDASQARRWNTRPDDRAEDRDRPPRRFGGRGGSPPPPFRGGRVNQGRGRGPPRHAPFHTPQQASHALPPWLRDARLEPGVLGLFESLYHRGLLSTHDLGPSALDELERMHPSLAMMAIDEFSALDHYRIRDLTSCFLDLCSRVGAPHYPPLDANGRSPHPDSPPRDMGYRPPGFPGGGRGGSMTRATSFSNPNPNDVPNLQRDPSMERMGSYHRPPLGGRGQAAPLTSRQQLPPPSGQMRAGPPPSDAQAQISFPVHRQASNNSINAGAASVQSTGQSQGQLTSDHQAEAQAIEKSSHVAEPASFEGPAQIIDALLGTGPSLDGCSSQLKKRRRAEAEALMLSGGGDVESHAWNQRALTSQEKGHPRTNYLVDQLSRPDHGYTLADLRAMRLSRDLELEEGKVLKGNVSSLMEDHEAMNVLRVIQDKAESLCVQQPSMMPHVIKRAMLFVSMSLSGLEGTGYLTARRIEVIQRLVEDGYHVLSREQRVLAVS